MYQWIAAKSSKENNTTWLPLQWHLMDTAGVIESLTKHWLPAAVFNEIGMDRKTALKYVKFLALTHDIGKATPVFQQKILPHLPEIRAKQESDGILTEASFDIGHAHAGAVLLRNCSYPESAAAIVGAHHGKPESIEEELDSEEELKNGKKKFGARTSLWGETQNLYCEWALKEAGYQSVKEIPEVSEQAQMILTGLLVMADWVASNTTYFPLISVDRLSLEYDTSRVNKAMKRLALPNPLYIDTDTWKHGDFFEGRFGFSGNEIQTAVLKTAANMQSPGLIILEAPMGEGKTEAALTAAEVMINRWNLGGIAFFLPSQATSNAMFERMMTWLSALPDAERVSVQLAHANSELNDLFAGLRSGEVQIEEDAKNVSNAIVHGFFCGRKTKLLSGIVVGTVDQLLMAGLKQKHVMLRHLGVAGKVVVIDECHAYDAYMNVYLDRVLEWLGAYHIPVILLSATLPGERREALVRAYAGKKRVKDINIRKNLAYPLLTWADDKNVKADAISYNKTGREVLIQKSQEAEVPEIVRTVYESGGCVGIILNTVGRVQEMAETLKKNFPEAKIQIDHAQLLLPDRVSHETEILKSVGKHSDSESRKQVIVVGSQVLEQSLDMDFDLLITDLCPMDLLLQRIGRLHRHNRKRPSELEQAKCIVLNADKNSLEDGAKAIYGEYLLKQTAALLPLVVKMPQDISILVQKTYSPEGGAVFPEAYAKYTQNIKEAQRKAKQFCIEKTSLGGEDGLIIGMLDEAIISDDSQAQATVRDGNSSIEVLLLQDTGDGYAKILAGANKGMRIPMDRQPSNEEVKELVRQRLRLPGKFSRRYHVNQTISELEDRERRKIPEWLKHPVLSGELFLLLDQEANANINGTQLRYDGERGLITGGNVK